MEFEFIHLYSQIFINWSIAVIISRCFFFLIDWCTMHKVLLNCRFKDDLPCHMNNRQVVGFTLVCRIWDLYATAYYWDPSVLDLLYWHFSHDCPSAVPITDLHVSPCSFVLCLSVYLSVTSIAIWTYWGFCSFLCPVINTMLERWFVP